MAIDSVSGATSAFGGVQAFNKVKSSFNQLATALQSGDLAGAQKAFDALSQNIQSGGRAKNGGAKDQDGDNDGDTKRKADFDAVASALKKGDLAGAQKAFAVLQQDAQAARAAHAGKTHRHRHGAGKSTNNVDNTAPSTDPASPVSSTSTLFGSRSVNKLDVLA